MTTETTILIEPRICNWASGPLQPSNSITVKNYTFVWIISAFRLPARVALLNSIVYFIHWSDYRAIRKKMVKMEHMSKRGTF